MTALDVMPIAADEDQPITCPKCGSRTDFKDVSARVQLHTCLGCAYSFLCEFDPW